MKSQHSDTRAGLLTRIFPEVLYFLKYFHRQHCRNGCDRNREPNNTEYRGVRYSADSPDTLRLETDRNSRSWDFYRPALSETFAAASRTREVNRCACAVTSPRGPGPDSKDGGGAVSSTVESYPIGMCINLLVTNLFIVVWIEVRVCSDSHCIALSDKFMVTACCCGYEMRIMWCIIPVY